MSQITTTYGAVGSEPADVERPPVICRLSSMQKRHKELDIYDPHDWKETLTGMAGTIYLSRAFFVVGIIGSVLVILSRIGGIGLTKDRVCRAWCSHLAIGSQAHQYVGIVLFLLMAFRNNQAYQMYQAGLQAHFTMKALLRSFIETALFRVPLEALNKHQRARLVTFAIVYPYAVTLDLRDEGVFDDADETLETLLSKEDLNDFQRAPTRPIYILDSLTAMVNEYCHQELPMATLNALYGSINGLIAPFGECERIKQNPCAFAYIAHMRLLLISYLVTLPLALVEQMGWGTIPVYWIVCYALMSLEMLAVDVENPFGYGASDLRLNVQNKLIKESILESWDRWESNLGQKAKSNATELSYSGLKSEVNNP